GPARAGARLRGPLGLAWRLQRGILVGWTVGVAAIGGATGALASDVKTLAEGNPQLTELLRQLGGGVDVVEAYLSQSLTAIALLSGGYVVQAVLRIRQEETALRAEPVLATAVSRIRWAGGHLVWVVVGAVVLLAGAGGAAGLLHGLRTGDVGGQLSRLVAVAVSQVPAVLVLAGVAVALTGLWPRRVALSWAAFGACVVLVEFGELLQLPGWVLDISPFRHTPQLPAVSPQAGPLLALLAVVLVLGAVGLVGLRRRDIG
ncbi:MAG: putative exporter of polyketide antibiotics-like protein, partial [Pseudonocardia sp.]|nr:putative exporter of polyketide antibiotics-like protein [Pseudonocardia sp.]